MRLNPITARIYGFVPEGGIMCQAKTEQDENPGSASLPTYQSGLGADAVWDAAVEACAEVADYWGKGNWKVQPQGRERFSRQDLQLHVNTTGRGIAEDIRKLKRSAPSQLEKARRAADASQPDQPLPDTKNIQGADNV